jgi:hypothetical protein
MQLHTAMCAVCCMTGTAEGTCRCCREESEDGGRRASSGSMNLTNEDNSKKGRTPLGVTQNLQRYSVQFVNPVRPSGHYMYHQLNIQQSYVLPTQCIYVFCVDLRTNSDYFPILHSLTGFYNPVVTICTASLTFNNSTFCPHSVFMCFVWISEHTAIFSLYNIN